MGNVMGSSRILGIIGLVLSIAVIIVLISFLIYKHRINKSLKEGKPPKRTLFTPGSTAVSVGVVLWIVSTVFILVQLGILVYNISNVVAYTERTNVVAYTERTIDDTSQLSHLGIANIQATDSNFRLLQSQMITDHYSFTVGNRDAVKKSAEIKVSVSPTVVVGEKDVLKFRFGDSSAQLVRGKNGEYTGTVSVSVYDITPSGVLTLEGDGYQLTQVLSDKEHLEYDPSSDQYATIDSVIDEDIWQSCFPYITSTEKSSTENVSADKVKLDFDLTISSHPAEADKKISFTEMKLVVEADEKKVHEVDLMKSSDVRKSDNDYAYSNTVTVSNVSEDTVYTYYVLAKDNQGYSYRIYPEGSTLDPEAYDYMTVFTHPNGLIGYGDTVETIDVKSSVYDKDGNTVIEFANNDFSFSMEEE